MLADDAVDQLASVRPEVIVEATGRFTTSRRRATDFFTRSTAVVARRPNGPARDTCCCPSSTAPDPRFQGYGYFAGKTAQERAAVADGRDATIVRSTQWFEFAAQNLERMRVGPVAFVPGMTIAPVALAAVATVIAEVATGHRTEPVVEVAGPESMSLWAMTTALPHPAWAPSRCRSRPDGSGLSGRRAPAGAEVEVVGPAFREWLAAARR